jgi:hypothetical protein
MAPVFFRKIAAEFPLSALTISAVRLSIEPLKAEQSPLNDTGKEIIMEKKQTSRTQRFKHRRVSFLAKYPRELGHPEGPRLLSCAGRGHDLQGACDLSGQPSCSCPGPYLSPKTIAREDA